MGHFILGNYGHERSGHLLELVQLVLIIGGSLLDNWEAAVLHSGNCKNLGNVTTSFRSKNLLKSNSLYTVPPQHKTSQFYTNHYGCKAVSTCVASLFHLKQLSKVVGVENRLF